MKNILHLVYSTKATLWLLLVFIIAMAAGTFIEDKHDTQTAFRLVYGAKWFEAVLVLLAINFIGNINRYHMLTQRKFGGLLFHSAFILMIVGAGVTRYFGYEGLMHIREGQSSNILVSPQQVLKVLLIDQGEEVRTDIPFQINDSADRDFKKTIETKVDGEMVIRFKNYYPHGTYSFIENVAGGKDYVKLNILNNGIESDIFIAHHETADAGRVKFSYNLAPDNQNIIIIEKDGRYFLQSPYELKTLTIPEMSEGILKAQKLFELSSNVQFSSPDNNFKFIFHGGFKNAVRQLVNGDPVQNNIKALVLNIDFKNNSYEVPLILNENGMAEMQKAPIAGTSLLLGYGEKEIRLPFSLYLNDFIVERYPGSTNPSSFASEVSMIDKRESVSQNFRIYMNHVLDYDGFRFFQSSYDKDEKGTVLSVNHDFWGTWITYLGYFLMGLGFLITLFNKNSRFQMLGRNIREIKKLRTKAVIILVCILGISNWASSQELVRNPVSKMHAEKLGRLIVQTYDGRSEPLHTLAFDVMHKISRKDEFDLPGKGKVDAMQVCLDMILDPTYWRNQKIIYIKEQALIDQLGLKGKYASFVELTDKDQNFKWKDLLETAFRKIPKDQNPVDKELIKLSERLDILMMLTQGSLLKIFPEPVLNSKVWISWDNPQAQILIQDNLNLSPELGIPQFNYNNLMGAYLNAAYTGCSSGDFSRADKILGYIEDIQRHSAIADLLPSPSQIDFELYYNKAKIFTTLRNLYGILAVFLLILAFIENFLEKRNKVVSFLLNLFLVLLVFAFAYHSFGLGLRWYLSGHAPWSNGYEALLLVAWAGILAGFSFIRYSKIPLAATALLAFFTLMTAGHSSYDPQITNLQPVLKSFWLIIHVATLTISYGFLGLAFILGIFILILYVSKTRNNRNRINLITKELSHINEMNITIGLVLATVGTFLGGVWANESWGRYWGWDAKETWALIITMVYTMVVHLRLVDKLRGDYYFSVGSVLGFGSVLMTFIGVNYYLSKGMHSYGAGETPIFPLWAWVCILAILALIVFAGIKEKRFRKELENNLQEELNSQKEI